ncbi:MAG: hypothetical protein L6Q92_16645 [Phycisphaerae bacterium]|nr:hypothetical protein [Phycisphaerae bacterium]
MLARRRDIAPCARWRRDWRTLPLLLLAVGCEEKPTLPPDLQQADAAPDVRRVARFRGSETITAAGVVLEIESAPGAPTMFTLRSSSSPRAHAVFLTWNATLRPEDKLTGRRMEISGAGSRWIGPATGLRSDDWRYQVESATVVIDTLEGDEARGRIEGAFWRFPRLEPTSKPPTAETLSGQFIARVIRR